MSELLDQTTSKWDEEVVKTHLCPLDVKAVLCQTRPRHGGVDFYAWSEKNTDIYTVRSAYQMLVNHIAATSGCSDQEHQWKKVVEA